MAGKAARLRYNLITKTPDPNSIFQSSTALNTTSDPQATEAIRLASLSYRYSDGVTALNDLNLSIHRGQTVALVGPNGAGKTTLLLHLNGIFPQAKAGWLASISHGHNHSGQGADKPVASSDQAGVWVEGLKVSPKTAPEIRRRVGLLFQDPDDQLFAMTVREDVAFGPINHGMDRKSALIWADECLAQVGLEHVGQRPPHHLSFGERKRVCLAGVLACKPTVLVMDEPTANLDPRARRRFLGLISSLNMTKLIATHDLEMVLEICDRVLLLDGGRLIADGSPIELLSNKELVEAHGLEVPPSLASRIQG